MSVKDNLLSSEICGIKMSTPIFAASGTFGFGEEFEDFVDLSRLGGVMVKGTTLKPRRGNEGVRITETPSGMLNCIGLENPGVEIFLKDTLFIISADHGAIDLKEVYINEIKENIEKLKNKVILDCHNIINLSSVYHI